MEKLEDLYKKLKKILSKTKYDYNKIRLWTDWMPPRIVIISGAFDTEKIHFIPIDNKYIIQKQGIGYKGAEKQFDSFESAIEYIKSLLPIND